jgi:signal transduction histidine kinase
VPPCHARPLLAQSWKSARPIDTDTVQNISNLRGSAFLFIDSNHTANLQNILSQPFVPVKEFEKNRLVPVRLVDDYFYLLFTLHNSADSSVTYNFYPGKNYREMNLYKVQPDQSLVGAGEISLASGFFEVTVAPGDSTTYLFRGKFFKTIINELQATLVAYHHMPSFETRMYKSMTSKKIVGILLSGMLLMMIIVMLLNYFMNRKKEFLFNALYSLCMFLLIFLTTFLVGQPGWLRGFFFSFFDLFLLISGTIFYIIFTRHFLESKQRFPKLDRLLRLELVFLVIILIGFCILYFGFESLRMEILYEDIVKMIMLVTALVYIVMALSLKDRLLNFLGVGLVFQILFYIISMTLNFSNARASQVFNSPFFYFQVGVIASVLSFLIGLFYKNRHELISKVKEQEALKTATEKQQFENKLAIYKAQQEERNRISADMHDDLGAGITSIRLYSELAKNRHENFEMPELEKISSSANELLNNMNAIIWSMSSHNDTLGNMVSYIRSYTSDYLEDTGIEHRISIPENLPAIEVSGTIRRNVFLVIKEALHNIVKHSGATMVNIEMKKYPDGFSLTIHDNGKGIDEANMRPHSNGLKNMKQRMHDIGVDISIENKEGTLITLYRKTR